MLARSIILGALYTVLLFYFHGNIISYFAIPWSAIENIFDLIVSSLLWLCYYSDLLFVPGTLKAILSISFFSILCFYQLKLVLWIYDLISKTK